MKNAFSVYTTNPGGNAFHLVGTARTSLFHAPSLAILPRTKEQQRAFGFPPGSDWSALAHEVRVAERLDSLGPGCYASDR